MTDAKNNRLSPRYTFNTHVTAGYVSGAVSVTPECTVREVTGTRTHSLYFTLEEKVSSFFLHGIAELTP